MAANISAASEGKVGEDDSSPWIIGERTGRIGIELDRRTGLALALLSEREPNQRERLPLRFAATLVTEGREVDDQPFGLAYADTVDLSTFSLTSPTVRHEYAGYDEIFTVETRAGEWRVEWEYRFRGSALRIEVQMILHRPAIVLRPRSAIFTSRSNSGRLTSTGGLSRRPVRQCGPGFRPASSSRRRR